MRHSRLLVAGLLLLVLASSIWAADLLISVVSLSSPVAPFTDATLQIQTTPGAACSITVLYKSGPSKAKGFYPQTSDSKGWVTWRWRVGSNTTPGRHIAFGTGAEREARGWISLTADLRGIPGGKEEGRNLILLDGSNRDSGSARLGADLGFQVLDELKAGASVTMLEPM